MVIHDAIDKAKSLAKAKNLAMAQVDVIAHSMGGDVGKDLGGK